MLEVLSRWDVARGAIQRGAVQKSAEFAGLIKFLQRRDLRSVVEVGTFRGGTFWAWCEIASDDALLVSVDLPGGQFGGGFDERQADVIGGYARGGQRVELVRGDSHDQAIVEGVARVLDGRQVDFLFIDGDHSYEGVRADFENFSPLVKEGGVVGFHDIVLHPFHPDCRVDRFWGELRKTHRVTEFVDGGGWGGIGVVEL